jgi:hypothetical protein
MEKELLQLEQRVQKLIEWKNERTKEWFVYPLDELSRRTLQKNSIVFTGNKITSIVGVQLTDFITLGLGVRINNKTRFVIAVRPLKPFTAAVTDIITSTNASHNLKSTDRMYMATTGTLPAGLSEADPYYPVSITATTFKVSLSEGGSPIDITDTGTGTHYYAKI